MSLLHRVRLVLLIFCFSLSGCFSIFDSSGPSEESELVKQYGIGGGTFPLRESRILRGAEPLKGPVTAHVGQLIWPLERARLTSKYGWRSPTFHEGLDLAAPSGTPIRASHHGKVLYSGRGFRGYGNIILLKGDNGLLSVYAHNRSNIVGKGQSIRQGQLIGYVGSTGRATGPHLHYELRVQNEKGKFPSVDPFLFYPAR